MPFPVLLLLLLATTLHELVHAGDLSPLEHHERFLHRAAVRRFASANGRNLDVVGNVFYPSAFGADPTGNQDSSGAMAAALQAAARSQTGRTLLPNVHDVGGVIVDLQGGSYKLNQPLRFPDGLGNLVFQGGTLRAADGFPENLSLVQLLPESGQDVIRFEDVTFRDVLFDSNFRGGGVVVADSARIRITNCFFIHFVSTGIKVVRGHETFVSSTFLGQILTVGGDRRERNFSGTAIELDGNDNAITDVAIFSAAVGLLITGSANIITGVHCYNKATWFGGVGIWLKLGGSAHTRIDNCYLDYTGILIEDPAHVHVTNGFFLGDAYILLRSVKGSISGLTIVDNMFAGSQWGPIVRLDESDGPFTTVEQVVVDRNIAKNMGLRSTVARKVVTGKNSTWTADFSGELLFPNRINHVHYSFVSMNKTASSFPPPHMVRSIEGNVVVVEASGPVEAAVSVEVHQNAMPGEKSPW